MSKQSTDTTTTSLASEKSCDHGSTDHQGSNHHAHSNSNRGYLREALDETVPPPDTSAGTDVNSSTYNGNVLDGDLLSVGRTDMLLDESDNQPTGAGMSLGSLSVSSELVPPPPPSTTDTNEQLQHLLDPPSYS